MSYDFYFGTDYTNTNNEFWFARLDSNYYGVVYGADRNFIKVSADADATISKGFVYITTTDGFYIVNLKTGLLCDVYTTTVEGRSGDLLDSEPVSDSSVL